MKNLAKNIAFAIGLSLLLFVGCNNDVDGTVGDSSKVISNSGSIEKLTVYATSDDSLVNFGSSSRTILPSALKAADLTFYLWGTDQINTSSTSSLSTPSVVVFNPNNDDGTEGTIAVDLSVSSYKLKLAAVFTTNVPSDVTVANVLAKAVVYGVADVDLRYNQEVKFYLSPYNIEGTGDVDIRLRTKDNWDNENYSVTVRIEDKATGATISNSASSTVSSEQKWYQYNVENQHFLKTVAASNTGDTSTDQKLASENGVRYYLPTVKAGSYNLVVDFYNGSRHFYYSDTLMVLTGQTSNKTNGGVTVTISDKDYYVVDIPNVIDREPAPPANFRVGYTDPTDLNTDKYLVTFEWDDKSNNEEYFVLQLLDLTECVSSTTTENDDTGLKATVSDGLYAFMNNTDSTKPNNETSVKDITNWKTLAGSTGAVKTQYRETIYQDFNTMYAAGSLNKGSTSVSLWLPLGSVYVARLTSFNSASSTPDSGFDGTTTGTSVNQWIYTTMPALTTNTPRSVNVNITTSGTAGTSYTPVSWTDKTATVVEGDEPLAINRYRVSYSLDGGAFQAVDQYGKPTAWDNPTQIKDTTNMKGLEPNYYNHITVYGNLSYYSCTSEKTKTGSTLTTGGTDILDPTIWNYRLADATATPAVDALYATLYRQKLSFKSWLKDSTDGTVYSKINWTLSSTTAETDLSKIYVLAKQGYGVVNCKYEDASKTTVSSTDSQDAKIYTNKVMEKKTYLGASDLYLVANYGANSGLVSIDNPEQYKLHSQNIRVYKWTGSADTDAPYSTVGATSNYVTPSASVSSTSVTSLFDYPDTANQYTDGEVRSGTRKVSNFYQNISFLVVENKCADSTNNESLDGLADIYSSAKVEIVSADGASTKATIKGVKTTYKVSSSTKGSGNEVVYNESVGTVGTDGSDPLLLNPANTSYGYVGTKDSTKYTHNAYYMVVKTSQLTPGKYQAKITVVTNEAKKPSYEYSVPFEITDPEYDENESSATFAFEAVTDYTSTTEGKYYVKNGSQYKLSPNYTTPASASPWHEKDTTNNNLYKLKTTAIPKW